MDGWMKMALMVIARQKKFSKTYENINTLIYKNKTSFLVAETMNQSANILSIYIEKYISNDLINSQGICLLFTTKEFFFALFDSNFKNFF